MRPARPGIGIRVSSIPVALVYSLFVEHYVTALTGAVALLCAGLILLSPHAAAEDRASWRWIAAGLALYGVATIWLGIRIASNPIVPVPYWTDAIWMCSGGMSSSKLC